MLVQMLDLQSGKANTIAGHRFLKLLTEDEMAFDNLFCVSFTMWMLSGLQNMLQDVLKSTRSQLERELALDGVSSVRDLPAYNLLKRFTWYENLKTMDGLQEMPVHHWRSSLFSGICSNIICRNDCLSNSIYNFNNGTSHNPLLPAFRGTLRETSPPFPRRGTGDHDRILNILLEYYFMRQLVSIAVEAPTERVMFLLQNQRELIKSGRLSTPYKGITDCFARIIKKEGVFSLWRGSSAKVYQIIPHKVLEIVLTFNFRNVVYNFKRDTDGKRNWTLGDSVAIAAASASTHLCMYPLEYAQIRLASDIKYDKTCGERQFKGVFDVLRKTLRSDGVRGIYRGINMGLIGAILGHNFYLPTRKSDPSKSISLERAVRDLADPMAFIVAAHPFTTLSRRMMMTSGETFKYKSSIDAFVRIIRNEGIGSLYNGFGANVLSIVPLLCVTVAWKKWRNRNGGLGASISVVIEPK